MDREELQRCCASPAYFFNNYVLVKDATGNWVKPDPVTDEQLHEAARKAQKEYRRQMDVRRWERLFSAMQYFPNTFRGLKVMIAITKED